MEWVSFDETGTVEVVLDGNIMYVKDYNVGMVQCLAVKPDSEGKLEVVGRCSVTRPVDYPVYLEGRKRADEPATTTLERIIKLTSPSRGNWTCEYTVIASASWAKGAPEKHVSFYEGRIVSPRDEDMDWHGARWEFS